MQIIDSIVGFAFFQVFLLLGLLCPERAWVSAQYGVKSLSTGTTRLLGLVHDTRYYAPTANDGRKRERGGGWLSDLPCEMNYWRASLISILCTARLTNAEKWQTALIRCTYYCSTGIDPVSKVIQISRRACGEVFM